MTLYYNNAEYQIVIDLTTGRMTITCLVNDILSTTIYLYDNNNNNNNNNTVPVANTSIQLSEEELHSIADNYVPYGSSYSLNVLLFEYHDYDKNGTYEAYALLGYIGQADVFAEEIIFISSDGKITSMSKWDSENRAFFDFNYSEDAYIEYSNKGFFLPTLSTGSITYNLMFSVKNNEPFQIEDLPRRVGLDEDGNLSYSGACTACYNNIEHKHVLIYHDDTQSVEATIVYN